MVPKLSPKLKKIRDTNFITAVMETGNLAEAARRTGKPTTQHSAESIGSEKLSKLEPTMIEALVNRGITTGKIAERVEDLLESQDPQFIDKGITQSMKMGLGGGYAAEKHQSVNVNVNTTPDDVTKYESLRKKYTEELLKNLANGNNT